MSFPEPTYSKAVTLAEQRADGRLLYLATKDVDVIIQIRPGLIG